MTAALSNADELRALEDETHKLETGRTIINSRLMAIQNRKRELIHQHLAANPIPPVVPLPTTRACTDGVQMRVLDLRPRDESFPVPLMTVGDPMPEAGPAMVGCGDDWHGPTCNGGCDVR